MEEEFGFWSALTTSLRARRTSQLQRPTSGAPGARCSDDSVSIKGRHVNNLDAVFNCHVAHRFFV